MPIRCEWPVRRGQDRQRCQAIGRPGASPGLLWFARTCRVASTSPYTSRGPRRTRTVSAEALPATANRGWRRKYRRFRRMKSGFPATQPPSPLPSLWRGARLSDCRANAAIPSRVPIETEKLCFDSMHLKCGRISNLTLAYMAILTNPKARIHGNCGKPQNCFIQTISGYLRL